MRGLGGAVTARSRLDERDFAVPVPSPPGDKACAADHLHLAERIHEAARFLRQREDNAKSNLGTQIRNPKLEIRNKYKIRMTEIMKQDKGNHELHEESFIVVLFRLSYSCYSCYSWF